jgi:hypothetical protein
VLQKLNTKRIYNLINKRANELNRQFSKEAVQMVNKYMKKCSISLAIKEMKSKLHRNSTSPQSEQQSSRKQTNAGKDVRRKKTPSLYTDSRNVN